MTDMVELGKWVMVEQVIDKALEALSKLCPEKLMLYINLLRGSSHQKEYIKMGIEALEAKSESVL